MGSAGASARPDPSIREAQYQAAAHFLKSGEDVTVVEADVTSPISETQALKAAEADASFLGGRLPSAHLVYFTDPWMGTPTSNSDGAPIIHFSDHRLTWLVLSWHATVPILGGDPGYKGPMSYIAGVATFVDARTGKVIVTMTIDDLR